MADKKVSQLSELASTDADLTADLLHIVDASSAESKKIKGLEFLNSVKNLTPMTPGNVDQANDKVILFDHSVGACTIVTVQSLVEKLRTETLTHSTGWEAITTGNGWSTNSNSAWKKFDHNLGTTDFQITLYAGADHNGSNAVWVNGLDAVLPDRARAKERYGANIHSISTTSFTVQLAANGYAVLGDDGLTTTLLNWSWIKIVCRK